MKIIEMSPDHWEAVREIYMQGIATKNATFQTDAPSWEEWNESHLPTPRFVIFIADRVGGWAALTPVSGRCVYAGVSEVSIYIHEDFRGKGMGSALLEKLIVASEQQNIWTLQSGIFTENLSSIALHEKHGFRTIGFREKIGKMNGIWRDTVLMERRSKLIGQD